MMKKICLIFAVLFMLSAVSFPVAYAAEVGAENTYINAEQSDTVTMYYINMPLQGLEIYSKALDNIHVDDDIQLTFLFTFNNVEIGEIPAPVMALWNIHVNKRDYISLGAYYARMSVLSFLDDIELNIRSEYYELLNSHSDFADDITITLIYEGEGSILFSDDGWMFGAPSVVHSINATLEQREVSPDYDPIEEEGQLPDNGGIAVNPVNDEISLSIASFLGVDVSVINGILKVLLYVAVVVVALFFIGFISRALKFAFGK